MSNKISQFAIATILVGVSTAPSYAQTTNLSIDSDHSDARFSIGGTMSKTGQTITLGTARVRGTLNLDKNDLTKSSFAFDLYPAVSVSPAIDQFGKPASGNSSNLADYTVVSFQSERVSLLGDGKLQVTGNLLVTRVTRTADYTANEAYAGPVYAPPMAHRTARQVSFVIAVPDSASIHDETSAKIEASATSLINQEDFPQLVEAIVDGDWPPMVPEQKCTLPASIGEDYSGASCITKVTQPSFPVNYIGSGEDYSGAHTAPVQLGNNLTILVHMQLTGQNGQLSASASR